MGYRMNTFLGVILMIAAILIGFVVNFENALFGHLPHFWNVTVTVAFIIGCFFFIFACQENVTLLKILCGVGVYSFIFGLLGYFQYGGYLMAFFAIPIGFCFYGVDYFGIHPYLAMAVVSFVMSVLSFWILIDMKKEMKEAKRLEQEEKVVGG